MCTINVCMFDSVHCLWVWQQERDTLDLWTRTQHTKAQHTSAERWLTVNTRSGCDNAGRQWAPGRPVPRSSHFCFLSRQSYSLSRVMMWGWACRLTSHICRNHYPRAETFRNHQTTLRTLASSNCRWSPARMAILLICKIFCKCSLVLSIMYHLKM